MKKRFVKYVSHATVWLVFGLLALLGPKPSAQPPGLTLTVNGSSSATVASGEPYTLSPSPR
jgi:hypothetical protein